MSNRTTTFSVRMDSSVKTSLDEFCAAVGMNTNTAINMFARVVTHEKRLPLDVSMDQFYNENNIRYLTTLKTDLESGKLKLAEHELIEIERNGYNGIGKPELLKGTLAGWWSVKIDDSNRLVFKITSEQNELEKNLEIYACKGHYGDK